MKITFVPLLAGKPWSGSTIYESSLGGSEAAVAYLAREFARRGHEVVVFSHGRPGVYENVQYLNLGNPSQIKCDLYIASRWVDALNLAPSGAFRVLWLHDLPSQPMKVVNVDKVAAISRFQAKAWGLISPDGEEHPKLFLTSDGVDLSMFDMPKKERNNHLVWISNPDRGLYIAINIFEREIHPRWPFLEFHIYGRASTYGWSSAAESPYIPDTLPSCIHLHESMPRISLARVLSEAWAMFYPTYWPETFCMAALEAQAAGCPVITSPVGALPETVKGGILTNDFPNAVSQLRNHSRWYKLSREGIRWAANFSWDKVAESWEGLVK